MSQNPGDINSMDPWGAWRSMRDQYMEQWSKAMIDMVNSDAYAEATGRVLDTYLSVSAPFRKAIESTMTQVLTQLNMPTRTDVTSLAERLTNVEMLLDDMDAKLDTLEHKARRAEEQAPPVPAALPSANSGDQDAAVRVETTPPATRATRGTKRERNSNGGNANS